MIIPPKYTITAEMVDLIAKIDGLRHFFHQFEYPTEVKQKVFRVSYLKSSLYSARIEGNPLTEQMIENAHDTTHKKEIYNILDAINYLEKTPVNMIDLPLILKLHGIVMKNIDDDAGILRKEASAIFDTYGNAVYITPSPETIKPSLAQLFIYHQNDIDKFPLISAFIVHLLFEKIHPFIDGNGRVGRLLINAVLKVKKYDFSFLIPYEEFIDTHKSEYYFHLDQGFKNVEAYLIFMLQAYYEQAEKIKELLGMEVDKLNQGLPVLPPRQEELYYVIKDHRIVSIDFLQRRFLKIPKRTLNYDLKKLINAGLVIKIGKTKGSYYSLANKYK